MDSGVPVFGAVLGMACLLGVAGWITAHRKDLQEHYVEVSGSVTSASTECILAKRAYFLGLIKYKDRSVIPCESYLEASKGRHRRVDVYNSITFKFVSPMNGQTYTGSTTVRFQSPQEAGTSGDDVTVFVNSQKPEKFEFGRVIKKWNRPVR